MKCPFCGELDNQVLDTRVSDDAASIRRRRRCAACQKRFTTFETAELHLPQVVKRGGAREEFNPDKLRISFQRALQKRPVPAQRVDEAVTRVQQTLLGLGEREVDSRRVGELVMQELFGLDKVAYVRFASVYRQFEDVNDFRDVIRDL